MNLVFAMNTKRFWARWSVAWSVLTFTTLFLLCSRGEASAIQAAAQAFVGALSVWITQRAMSVLWRAALEEDLGRRTAGS